MIQTAAWGRGPGGARAGASALACRRRGKGGSTVATLDAHATKGKKEKKQTAEQSLYDEAATAAAATGVLAAGALASWAAKAS